MFLQLVLRNSSSFVIFNFVWSILSTQKRISMWKSLIDCQDLSKCLCSLQETSHGIDAIFIVMCLRVCNELGNFLDKKLRVFLLLTVHQWKDKEEFLNESIFIKFYWTSNNFFTDSESNVIEFELLFLISIIHTR